MATQAEELRKLESEAHECERSGDSLGALDIYEEIVRRGWANSKHLTALGYCYIKSRQRQNAKEIWLRALELEPGDKLCREALDKHFPGWEDRSKGAPRLERQKEMPPPPPPASFGQDLSVEATSVVVTQARQQPKTEPEPASRPAAPQPVAAPRPGQIAPMRPSPATALVSRIDSAALSDHQVNWDFVMQDVAEEAAFRRR